MAIQTLTCDLHRVRRRLLLSQLLHEAEHSVGDVMRIGHNAIQDQQVREELLAADLDEDIVRWCSRELAQSQREWMLGVHFEDALRELELVAVRAQDAFELRAQHSVWTY